MTNMSASEASNVLDHAASQNDRWLFLAMLMIFILAVGFFWRWMVADREKVAARLTEITDRHINAGERLGEVVANNTVALREVKDAIAFCRLRGEGERPRRFAGCAGEERDQQPTTNIQHPTSNIEHPTSR